MECHECDIETVLIKLDHIFTVKNELITITNVPTLRCSKCTAEFFDAITSDNLDKISMIDKKTVIDYEELLKI